MRFNSIGLQLGVSFVIFTAVVVRIMMDDHHAAKWNAVTAAAESGVNYVVKAASTLPGETDDKTMMEQIPARAAAYPENEDGRTYGSAAAGTSIETLPDLISAGSIDGTAGYVLKEDFLDERPNDPEETPNIQENQSASSRDTPLYAVDGKTVIGSIHIGAVNQYLGKKTSFPKNENGQTYGSAADASFETRPDLIRAIGTNGTVGYVLAKDLDGEQPKTPEEALAIQKNRPAGGRDIPLYEADGKTVIGMFHIE